MAERQGFEPWEGYKPSMVFKTIAFNRSATSPSIRRLSNEGEAYPILVAVCQYLRNLFLVELSNYLSILTHRTPSSLL